MNILVHSRMSRPAVTLAMILATMVCLTADASAREASVELPIGVQQPGAVFLRVENPGQLWVTLRKRDLNESTRRAQSNIYAYLVGPDRKPLDHATLLDDGKEAGSGPGSVQEVTLRAEVPHAGIYKLLVVMTGFDGRGYDTSWGLRTNASGLMVNHGARGNAPIDLLNPGTPTTVYFTPSSNAFNIEVTPLRNIVQQVTLLDEHGQVIDTLDVDGANTASLAVKPSGQSSQMFMGLHVPDQSVRISIDGVTRSRHWNWSYEEATYWTTSPDYWFPIRDYRWAIYPHHKHVRVEPGEHGEFLMHLRNHGSQPDRFDINVMSIGESQIEMIPPPSTVDIAPGTTESLSISFRVPEHLDRETIDSYHIFVKPERGDGLQAYATVEFSRRTEDAEPLDLPIVLDPYNHENRQFGYDPRYPINEVNFDLENRPFIRDDRDRYIAEGIYTVEDGEFKIREFTTAIKSAFPEFTHTHMGGRFLSTKTAFCTQNYVYTVLVALGEDRRANNAQLMLLRSTDQGRSFDAYPVGQRGQMVFDFEHFTGHNDIKGPPPIVAYRQTEDLGLRWGYRNQLELYVPQATDEGIEIGEPIILSQNAISLATHSGGAATIASKGNHVHVVWGEIVDPSDASNAEGVPVYAITYDREQATVGERVFLGYAPPVNDMHNSPGITLDSRGYLHVVFGAHAENPFRYTRSLQPNRTDAGWTEPENVLSTGILYHGVGPHEHGAQTYVGLVCDPDDTLHLVFRHDIQNMNGRFENFDRRYRALSHQKRPANGEWEEHATKLIVPPFPGYSVYYHKLSIDRNGRLFVPYVYRSTQAVYRMDLPGAENHPAMLMSEDAGNSWRLVRLEDLLN